MNGETSIHGLARLSNRGSPRHHQGLWGSPVYHRRPRAWLTVRVHRRR